MEERRFDASRTREIATHIDAVTGGAMDRDWAAFVLTRIIAGPEAVCDLWRAGERVGVAVSIDNCQTEGNAAELSVFLTHRDDHAGLAALLDWGEARARAAGRSNVDVPEWSGLRLPVDVLSARGYRVGHVMYTMDRGADAPAVPVPPPLPAGWSWRKVDDTWVRGYYDTVRAAMAEVPGAFVSDFASFAARLPVFDPPPLVLVDHGAPPAVAGFLRVTRVADDLGELSLVGRHPRCRGLGLGPHLVARGLALLAELGLPRARLEVAAGNRRALTLYERAGFAVSASMNVFRRSLD